MRQIWRETVSRAPQYLKIDKQGKLSLLPFVNFCQRCCAAHKILLVQL